jgi:hypothetical protein
MKPLPPLEPLPSLWDTKRKKRVLGWATVLAVLCAIGVGILHGLGSKIFDAAWAYVERVVRSP